MARIIIRRGPMADPEEEVPTPEEEDVAGEEDAVEEEEEEIAEEAIEDEEEEAAEENDEEVLEEEEEEEEPRAPPSAMTRKHVVRNASGRPKPSLSERISGISGGPAAKTATEKSTEPDGAPPTTASKPKPTKHSLKRDLAESWATHKTAQRELNKMRSTPMKLLSVVKAVFKLLAKAFAMLAVIICVYLTCQTALRDAEQSGQTSRRANIGRKLHAAAKKAQSAFGETASTKHLGWLTWAYGSSSNAPSAGASGDVPAAGSPEAAELLSSAAKQIEQNAEQLNALAQELQSLREKLDRQGEPIRAEKGDDPPPPDDNL